MIHSTNPTRFLLKISSVALLILSTSAIAQTQEISKFPEQVATSLADKKFNLPRELPAEKTLVLIAFEKEQQRNLDTWITGLKLNSSDIPWIETPVIDPQNAFVRAMINGSMRLTISDQAIRERTVTLYTDRMAFARSMQIGTTFKNVYVAVVDRTGNVITVVEGDYSEAKAKRLLAAF